MPQLAHHCAGKKDLGTEGDEKRESDPQMGSSVTSQERDGGPWQAVCGEELHQVLTRVVWPSATKQ